MTPDSNHNQLRVLVVEDDADIARLVMLHLEDINAQVMHCADGVSAVEEAFEGCWDLIILDLKLPGIGGLEICRKLRDQGNQTPILMMTAKTSELDRVLGLELGADDYVTKPFSPIELVARVKAILRRAARQVREEGTASQDELLNCGPLTISTLRREVRCSDQLIELTSREFDLLLHFARHPGQVFKRSELLDQVWGYGHEGYEHTVNSHINRLRAKIENDPASPSHILTVWGVGYKFAKLVAPT